MSICCSEELWPQNHQTPTLIGCMFLTYRAKWISSFFADLLWSAKPWIVAQFFKNWKTFLFCFQLTASSLLLAKPWIIYRIFTRLQTRPKVFHQLAASSFISEALYFNTTLKRKKQKTKLSQHLRNQQPPKKPQIAKRRKCSTKNRHGEEKCKNYQQFSIWAQGGAGTGCGLSVRPAIMNSISAAQLAKWQ